MRELFRWDPPCWDPRWQKELDRIAPPTERGPSSLRLVWVPGEPWTPAHRVQRWCIYQMTPIERVPDFIRHDLLGPNPRWFGYWSPTDQRFIRERGFTIDRLQWVLFQDTGLFGQLWWVLQGPAGGHKRRWDDFESGISLTMDGPEQPPPPGDLPYRPFSRAVLEAVQSYDLVRRYRLALDFMSRGYRGVEQQESDAEKRMRAVVYDTVSEQVSEVMTFSRAQLDAIGEALPRLDAPAPDMDESAIRESFINAA